MEGYEYSNLGTKSSTNTHRNAKPIIKDSDNVGISIRSIREVFDQAKKLISNKSKNIKISCSFLQIYNEKIYDLLNLGNIQLKSSPEGIGGLKMRWNKSEQFVVENLFVFECFSEDDALKLFNTGIKNRIVATHNINNASSRSHCIFTLNVEVTDLNDMNNVICSKLQLVDLAGSERTGLTGSTGVGYKESIDINKSLLTLRKVINGLSDKSNMSQHIPYRESKLTCLLKQSLGGNSYCLMIACLHPSDKFLEENVSTLTYATKASYIFNEPNKNEDPRMKIIHELQKKVTSLEAELKAANNHIAFLTNLTGDRKSSNNNFPNSDVNENDTRMRDSISLSIQKSEGIRADEEFLMNSSSCKILPLIKEKSAPIDSTQIYTNTEIENSKSETAEDLVSIKNDTSKNKIIQKSLMKNQELGEINNYIVKLDSGTISQRLIESVSMVTELLQSNRQLRDCINMLSKEKENIEGDNSVLQTDNLELCDRIEILEGIIKANANEFENYDWSKIIENYNMRDDTLSSEYSSNKGIKSVINSMINIKQENRMLKKRNEHLELQISNLTYHFDYQGNIEPTQTLINFNKDTNLN